MQYNRDDSHAFGDWNADPPFDPEHYGVTLSLVGGKIDRSIVGKYTGSAREGSHRSDYSCARWPAQGGGLQARQNIANARVALGEGSNREMSDWGWISDKNSGATVWEMTYSMTFHAGGARKNRMVMTTIVLERGEYRLRWRSDDSHSYNNWNMEPPDDQQFWGITKNVQL